MKPVMLERLRQMQERLSSLDIQLSQPDVAEDLERLRTTSQARATLALPIELYQRYQYFERELAQAQTLTSDPSMREMVEVEVALCREEMERLGREIQSALLPGDPADGRNVFIEVRAGTGGDESSLFAADLARMYTRFVERRGWRLETISSSPSEIGGFKEVILRVIGEGAYAWLKFESGGHRVQRIPTTESQGRIHTSACTVAVMPEADPLQSVTIDPSDLRVDTFRASGAGGQHVNRTDSAVRLTHLPTGVVVECQDDRSQHRNKAQAMAVLLARLEERQRQEHADRTAAARRSLIGSGDRSERIRTYNFPQNRVTDHRIHLTVHKIDSLMDGALDELLLALRHAYEAEQMEALETQTQAAD